MQSLPVLFKITKGVKQRVAINFKGLVLIQEKSDFQLKKITDAVIISI